MSPPGTPKRRAPPPPIRIPRPQQQRITPGPNAFALAAQAKQDAAEQQDKRATDQSSVTSPLDGPPSGQSQKDARSTGTRASARTTFGQIMDAARASSPKKSGSRPSTATSRLTKSTDRSRHSHQSKRSTGSTQPLIQKAYEEGKKAGNRSRDQAEKEQILPWDYDKVDVQGTVRATYEDRSEKKSLKVMGQARQDYDGSNPTVLAGRYTDVNLLADKAPEALKSPKKKLFGMSFPIPSGMSLGFGKSAHVQPVPENIPPKAAEALGITKRPITGRRDTPSQPWRPAPRAPRADTAKSAQSLPAKMDDGPDQWGRQTTQHASMPARHRESNRGPQSPVKEGRQEPLPSHKRTPSRRSQSPDKAVPLKAEASFDFGTPPTPPAKDTPREVKDKAQRDGDSDAGEGEEKEVDVGRIPSFMTSAKTVPSDGGRSPTKFCPFPAEEYAKLVEGHSIVSECAEMDNVAVELEGDTMHPGFNSDDIEQKKKYPEWWTAERQRRFTKANGDIPSLPPAFYSPSVFSARLFEGGRPSQNTDKERLLFAVPTRPKTDSMRSDNRDSSIDVIFQGSPSEIDRSSSTAHMVNGADQRLAHSPAKNSEPGLATKAMQELHLNGQADGAPTTGSASQPLQTDQSSSRLTDMLDGVSPAKGFHRDNSAYFASAQPSPLFHMSGPPNAMGPPPPPMGPASAAPSPVWPGTLSDGSNILTHFYMLHSHVDVVGKTFYDLVEGGKGEARESAKEIKEKQADLFALLEQRFDDVKAEISAVGRTTERVSEQSSAVNAKLDKLQEYIKNEVVERLAKQAKKNADMENNIKALQSTVQDLQKAVEANSKQSQYLPGTQSMFTSPLPNHRSQPSLTGYYESTNDTGRDNHHQRMPAIQESRNDGRFAYSNYGNGNTGNGQPWYQRPATAGRDTVNRDENTPFPASNPYNQNNPLQARSGNVQNGYMSGGYGGYYAGGPNETNFGYNHGNPK